MNKYLLFGGSVYYPCGGFDDYQDEFDSLELAEAYAKVGLITEFETVDLES